MTRHRIKPGKKGGKYLPGNVIGLCPNHHVEAEMGLIPQYKLFAIVQSRLQRTLKSEDKVNGFVNGAGPTQTSTERIAFIAYAPGKASRNGHKPI